METLNSFLPVIACALALFCALLLYLLYQQSQDLGRHGIPKKLDRSVLRKYFRPFELYVTVNKINGADKYLMVAACNNDGWMRNRLYEISADDYNTVIQNIGREHRLVTKNGSVTGEYELVHTDETEKEE